MRKLPDGRCNIMNGLMAAVILIVIPKKRYRWKHELLRLLTCFKPWLQSRPYRDALSPEKILSILEREVKDGRLDQNIVAMIEKNLLVCWKTAVLLP